MRYRVVLLIGVFSFWLEASGQSGVIVDSVKLLDAIIVQGYASDRPINQVPAAIGFLDQTKLERFNSTSILPAVNTIPGVRMEERSPGSYRFAIRGSSLRSPFGVRNVKIYWNGLPLTDGGGNTYLNLVDFNAIGSVEVVKGPGSSLYGAGTGGVVLLTSPVVKSNQIQASNSIGSYGLERFQLGAQTSSSRMKFRVQLSHQQATGYRIQSAMRKDGVNTDLHYKISGRSLFSGTFFYSDLFYQTPGGLTRTEFNTNKKQARPGAQAQDASIHNKTGYLALSHEYEWNSHWSNRTGIYGSSTRFINPALRNYEKRIETNWGARTETFYRLAGSNWKSKLTLGGEFQFFTSPVTDYGNRSGVKDTVQFADHLGATQVVLFSQVELDLPANFFLTVGGSTSFLQYRFLRTSEQEPQQQTRNFTPVVSPRIALLKKLSPFISVYGSVSKGFSTPSLAEVRPSSNLYNNSLNPESGRNYEAGLRGSLFNQKVTFELTEYYFNLHNTIVTPDGGDHYTNSGQTSQPGTEAGVGWTILSGAASGVTEVRVWSNFTYNPYKFKDYHVGTADYSGTKLTGVARDIIVSGADISLRSGLYGALTFTHTGAIALNDGNRAAAPSYYLLSAKAGYRCTIGTHRAELSAGVDNAFNTRYSLGNDLNAIGGRYYNAAAPQNFYVLLKAVL